MHLVSCECVTKPYSNFNLVVVRPDMLYGLWRVLASQELTSPKDESRRIEDVEMDVWAYKKRVLGMKLFGAR